MTCAQVVLVSNEMHSGEGCLNWLGYMCYSTACCRACICIVLYSICIVLSRFQSCHQFRQSMLRLCVGRVSMWFSSQLCLFISKPLQWLFNFSRVAEHFTHVILWKKAAFWSRGTCKPFRGASSSSGGDTFQGGSVMSSYQSHELT